MGVLEQFLNMADGSIAALRNPNVVATIKAELDVKNDLVAMQEPNSSTSFMYNRALMRVEDLRLDKPTIVNYKRFMSIVQAKWAAAVTENSIIRPTEGYTRTRVILNLNNSSAYPCYNIEGSPINNDIGTGAAIVKIDSGRYGYNQLTNQIEPASWDSFNVDISAQSLGWFRLSFIPKYIPNTGYSRISQQGIDVVDNATGTVSGSFIHEPIDKNSYQLLPDYNYYCEPIDNFAVTVGPIAPAVFPSFKVLMIGLGELSFAGGSAAALAAAIAASPLTGFLVSSAVGTDVVLQTVSGQEIFSVTGDPSLVLTYTGLDDVFAKVKTFMPSAFGDIGLFVLPQRVFMMTDKAKNHRVTFEAICAGSDMSIEVISLLADRIKKTGKLVSESLPGFS